MPRLCVSLLGAFSATLGGNPIRGFKTDKVRALLAYLAVERNRAHRRDALVGLLWPDFPESAARGNLRYSLTSLRKALGDDQSQSPYLLVFGDTIQFNPASDYWLDVQAFEDRLRPASPADDGHIRLEEAVALYKGSFLEGFSLRDSPAFDNWSLLEGEQLRRQAIQALSRLAEWNEQNGDYDEACGFARKILELEPWEEGAHRRVMRLLAESGQRPAALAQYEACRRSLADELGIEPAAETSQLYERIRDGSVAGTPAEEAPPHNLPASLSPLIGRQVELLEINERLLDSSCRLLTLLGPGGIGKTRLALEATASLVKYFRNGAYFVSLAPVQSIDSIPPAIARALSFSFSPGGEPLQQLMAYLRKKELLLVLDNFEHLLEGAEMIVDILQAAPGVKALVTSREALDLSEEFLFPVGGLDYPDPKIQDPLHFDAVQLFLEGARRACPHYRAVGDDLAQIGLVCRLVQGMPLAVLLAASWMKLLSPEEISRQIASQSLDFLEAEWRDAPEGQRIMPRGIMRWGSMRLVFEHSWQLLSVGEQQLFASLSVFRGSFTQAAAEVVAGARLRDLFSLAIKSMLSRTAQSGAAGRFEMHELLRQYAAEKLEQAPALSQAVHERFAAFYIAALQYLVPDLQGPRQVEALQAFGADFANARAAWDWAVENEQVSCLGRGMDGLGEFYNRRGRIREGEGAFQATAEKLKEMIHAHPIRDDRGGDERLRVLAKALAWQANFSRLSGHNEAVRQALEESQALLDNPGLADRDTRLETAFTLYQLGMLQWWPDLRLARGLFLHSLALWREVGDRWWTAKVLADLGHLAENAGDFPEAWRMTEESLSIRRLLGDRHGVADALLEIYYIADAESKYEESLPPIQESLAIFQEMGDRAGVGRCLMALGWYNKDREKWQETMALFDESAEIFEELGIRQDFGVSILIRGFVGVRLGLIEKGRSDLQTALEIFTETDDLRWLCNYYRYVGTLEVLEGHLLEALHHMQERLAISRKVGFRHIPIVALADLAKVECLLEHFGLVRQHLGEALALAIEKNDLDGGSACLPAAALLLASQHEFERAVEIYSLADNYHNYGGLVVSHVLEEEHIKAITASLPAEVIAAAEEHGRGRDLLATLKELLAEFS